MLLEDFSLAAVSRGYSSLQCTGFSCCGAQALGPGALVVVAHGLCCHTARGIIPDQGLNPCPLHLQAMLNHCTTKEVLKGFSRAEAAKASPQLQSF